MYHALHFPLCFHSVIFMYHFIIGTRKQTVLTKDSSLFRKRLTIHHFNVKTAMAENKVEDTLSTNIKSTQFQNRCFLI